MADEDRISGKSGFHTKKLLILLACRIVDPLAIMSTIPYSLFMVQHVGGKNLRENDAEATRMVALLIAVYSGAQFVTNMFWARVSNSVGRRPVMLLGFASTLVGTFGFGFSRSIPVMFAFRFVPGLFSGTVVVVRTMVGELTTGRENKALAFAWNQTAFQIGTVLGPLFGGYLAQPCDRYPQLCEDPRLHFLETFPFVLPSLIISILSALTLVVGYFFIEETLDAKPTIVHDSERSPLLPSGPSEEAMTKEADPGWKDVLTAPIIHIVLSYLLMALHTSCFDQIFPAHLASRPAPSHPPFRLNGGLGLPAASVANFVSGAGAVTILVMVLVFPPVSARIGSITGLRLSLLLYPVAYFALPYLALLPPPSSSSWVRILAVGAVVGAKTLAFVFSFNEMAVLVNSCAPDAKTLGLVNGLAQTAAAGGRAVGPALMGLFIQAGSKIDCSALGWFFLALVASAGAVQGFWVVDASDEDDN